MKDRSQQPATQFPPPWLVRWFDSDYAPEGVEAMRRAPDRVDWARCIPFVVLHAGCLGVWWCGVSPFAVGLAVALYVIRMFFITAGLHRYFSHRSFKTSRAFAFVLALGAATAVQRGALWWAANHRHHHRHSDEPEDIHSPVAHGFWWSHIGWITSRRHFPTNYAEIRDFTKYPELVFLNRYDTLVPMLFAAGLYALGAILEWRAPGLGVTGAQALVWGFFISTTALFHGTASINSFSHLFGTRRFATDDHSRNNALLALITLGEGWHNNHHRHRHSVRQGFYWWEFDPTWWGLRLLAVLGLVRDLKGVPDAIYAEARSAGKIPAGTRENSQGAEIS